jgi:hypothetical protein
VGSYFAISVSVLVYEQAELVAAADSGVPPPSTTALLGSNAVAIVACVACALRLVLPLSTRWPTWVAVPAALGPAAYWGMVAWASVPRALGQYAPLPFVPVPLLAITLYAVREGEVRTREVDALAGLMYKTKAT